MKTGILMTEEDAKIVTTRNGVELAQLITDDEVRQLATEYGIEYASVRAIMEVEGGQLAYYPNSYDPILLFESHWFHKFTKGSYDKEYPILSTPKPNAALYKLNQRNRFAAAFALDDTAAIMSASWGCMQVMGFNYRLVGYTNVFTFCQNMFISQMWQVKAGLEYIKNAGLLEFVRLHQWAKVAYGYNGAGFAKNKYDVKLKNAYDKWHEIEKKQLASIASVKETIFIQTTPQPPTTTLSL